MPIQGIAYAWYPEFIQTRLDAQAYTWIAKVVVIGALLVEIVLILGIFVGLTAFFGGFLNWNFIMTGSASVNGVFFGLSRYADFRLEDRRLHRAGLLPAAPTGQFVDTGKTAPE